MKGDRKFIKYKNNYIVSSDGEIWKITNSGLKVVKQSIQKYGYRTVSINSKTEKVHRIVMQAFKGESKLTVDHLDMNKDNNSLDNLEYVTAAENTKRSITNGHSVKNRKAIMWNGKVYYGLKELSIASDRAYSSVGSALQRGVKLNGHYAKYI